MPANAARFADPDHIVPLDKVAPLLAEIVDEWSQERRARARRASDEQDQPADASAAAQHGDPSEFTCPECGGTLWEQQEGDLLRFRCRVGHAYSTESLLADQREALEAALWGAVVALEERADLATRLARRMEERGRAHRAGRYTREAADARRRAALVREAIAHLTVAESQGADADG
jgi:two-component system chemotaxis response regulator CheB